MRLQRFRELACRHAARGVAVMPADVLEQQSSDCQFVDALDLVGVEEFDGDPEEPRSATEIEALAGQGVRLYAPGVKNPLQLGLRPLFDQYAVGRRCHRRADLGMMPGVRRDDQPAADLVQESRHRVDPAWPGEANRLVESVDPAREPDTPGPGIGAPALEPANPAPTYVVGEDIAGLR